MDQKHPPAQPHQEDPEAERSLPAELLESARLRHTGEDNLALLDFTSRLRNFAPFNAMVLQVQKAALTYAASACDWQILRIAPRPRIGLHQRGLKFEPKADRSHG
jgi:hypothetical protein